jgi:hypothetical protein
MSTIYNNYSISAGKGKLYLKSKTPQEGYEEILYGTGEVKDKTYHRYADSIKGLPSFFEIKEKSGINFKRIQCLSPSSKK